MPQVSEIDICRTAKVVMARHVKNAHHRASSRTAELRNVGDHDGASGHVSLPPAWTEATRPNIVRDRPRLR